MPRTCTVCAHPERAAIDAALVAGTPYRTLADRFGLSKTALIRHASEHIPKAIAKSQEAREEAQALDVVKQLKVINGVTMEILSTARRRGKPDIALKAIDRIQRQIELQAKLLGELSDAPQVNILVAPEWLRVRAAIMAALAPYVEARMAVSRALVALDGGSNDQRSA